MGGCSVTFRREQEGYSRIVCPLGGFIPVGVGEFFESAIPFSPLQSSLVSNAKTASSFSREEAAASAARLHAHFNVSPAWE